MPELNEDQLDATLAGMLIGALTEALYESLRQLGRVSKGEEASKEAAVEIEARVLLSAANAPLDGIPEHQQVVLIEQCRSLVSQTFRKFREG